jgi:hypothetical protein
LLFAARHTLVVGVAEGGYQFALDLAHGLGIEAGLKIVKAFVRSSDQ